MQRSGITRCSCGAGLHARIGSRKQSRTHARRLSIGLSNHVTENAHDRSSQGSAAAGLSRGRFQNSNLRVALVHSCRPVHVDDHTGGLRAGPLFLDLDGTQNQETKIVRLRRIPESRSLIPRKPRLVANPPPPPLSLPCPSVVCRDRAKSSVRSGRVMWAAGRGGGPGVGGGTGARF